MANASPYRNNGISIPVIAWEGFQSPALIRLLFILFSFCRICMRSVYSMFRQGARIGKGLFRIFAVSNI